MDILQICMLAMVGISTALLLKSSRSDLLPLLRLALTVAFCFAGIRMAAPIVSYLGELGSTSALAEYAPILFKALGIALLTQTCAEICRDCSEGSLAQGVETVGKLQILLLSLPLVKELFTLACKLLEWGDV